MDTVDMYTLKPIFKGNFISQISMYFMTDVPSTTHTHMKSLNYVQKFYMQNGNKFNYTLYIDTQSIP